jgi:CBS domain-containing protein
MTPFPHAISADSNVVEARAMMEEHDFHHLPVTKNDELVGIISSGHIDRALALDSRQSDLTVQKVCAVRPYVADIHARLADVVTHMADQGLDSALVTRNGKLVGILTHSDVSRVLSQLLHELSDDPPDGVA